MNILTAALGAGGGGVASLSKRRNYSGKTAFNEEAMSFCMSGVNTTQSVMDIDAADGCKSSKSGMPGASFQTALKSLACRNVLNMAVAKVAVA